MNLWTWQRKGLKIYDPKIKMDSRKYSYYLNYPYYNKYERIRIIKAYQHLWEIIGTDQILWCYTAKNEASRAKDNYWCKDCDLWEIELPDSSIKFICGVAWHWLLLGCECAPPRRFHNEWVWIEIENPSVKLETFYSQFHDYWKNRGRLPIYGKNRGRLPIYKKNLIFIEKTAFI